MVREINGLSGIPTSNKSTEKGSGKPSGSTVDGGSAGASTPDTEGVQLSAEARTLQSLTDQVKNLPETNLERAEQIKQALESGQYQIDDLVIADKILQSEAFFGK